MAITVNKDMLSDEDLDNPETKFIPAGIHPGVLVSYVELGKHYREFKGQKATYDAKSKKAGEIKPPELFISLCFEFPTVEFTGNFPLCISTSVPMKAGGFISALTVSDALANGTLSRSYAMKTNFMKYLMAMQDASGKDLHSLAEFVGDSFLITVTNSTGKPDQDGNIRTYANMKPEGIQGMSFKHPMTGVVEQVPAPFVLGDYCPVFDWDAPVMEDFMKLPKYFRDAIQRAENYAGSPLDMLFHGSPSSEGTSTQTAPKADTEPARPAQPDDEDVPF